ncbi:MAG: hypothetical protein ABIU54_11405 [Candidatus Eisenbacteria bacterium]
MRHAIHTLALSALTLAIATSAAVAAPQVVSSVNGIGLIDYTRKPTFKVGDWASYRMTGKSDMGMTDDYSITVLIAGDEEWWGERCFWIETWTDRPGHSPKTTASLMSYAIFADSLPIQRMQMYQRKTINGLDENGKLVQEVSRAAASALKSRTLFRRPLQWDVDTIGVDTVITPKGTFQTQVVTLKQGTGGTSTVGDSSIYTEVRENRTSYQSQQVPITHIVREDLESIIARKTWMIGRSSEGSPLNIRDRGLGSARLLDYGQGKSPRMVPKERQRSLSDVRPSRPSAPVRARSRR